MRRIAELLAVLAAACDGSIEPPHSTPPWRVGTPAIEPVPEEPTLPPVAEAPEEAEPYIPPLEAVNDY